MSTFIHSLRGQMSTPLYELGGKCPHIQFLSRGQMSEGANVRIPKIEHFWTVLMFYSNLRMLKLDPDFGT